MTASIDTYFTAERAESLLFVAFGILAIAAAAHLLIRYGDAMSRGLAIPLVLVGLIQIAVGGSVYLRTPAQIATLKSQLQQSPAAYQADEVARMATVMNNFRTYKVIEVGFILVGLAGTLILAQPFWLGIAMGMLIQGALMLPADVTAESRGSVYQSAIARAA